MKQILLIDFIYPAFLFILGIVMITSPRSLMGRAKYDKESMKTESWVKKLGYVVALGSVGLAVYFYYKMNNA